MLTQVYYFFKNKEEKPAAFIVYDYTPKGIRIPVTSVKGRCPRPLDDGGLCNYFCDNVNVIYKLKNVNSYNTLLLNTMYYLF